MHGQPNIKTYMYILHERCILLKMHNIRHHMRMNGRNGADDVVTRLPTGQFGVESRKRRGFYSTPKYSDRLWGSSSLFNG